MCTQSSMAETDSLTVFPKATTTAVIHLYCCFRLCCDELLSALGFTTVLNHGTPVNRVSNRIFQVIIGVRIHLAGETNILQRLNQ